MSTLHETAIPVARPWGEPQGPDDEPDLLGQYLTQIAATPLLRAEEEVELAQRMEAGSQATRRLEQAEAEGRELPADELRRLEQKARDGLAAKDHMIRANLRLVVSMAKRHAHRGLPLLDVIQEGNLGLIRAVEKFDYTKGFKFSTYATWWIRQSIERGLAMRARTVRLPVHVVEDLSKLAKVERRLQLTLGQEPTAAQVAEAADMPVERVERLRRAGREAISLDTPVGDDGQTVIGDLIQDSEVLQAAEAVEFKALGEQLRAAVGTLPPREAMILTLRYGLHDGRPHTLQEVADQVGLTRERVRQLERLSLAHLRSSQGGQLMEWAS